MSAIFGPAGNSENFPYKSSTDAPRWLAELGLDCYEYQCGKGVHVGEETARKVGQAAAEHGIVLSLHAPYFINLANPDPAALQKTIGYITGACLAADWMGARRVVIHSGALMKRSRREALDIALRALKEVVAACDGAGFGHITLCPETMGKINQLGDLDEVLELCTVDERLLPCVDFGHLYARSLGADDGAEAMERMLDRMEAVLGPDRAGRFHSHFSHIEFTPNGGEKRHRTFTDDGGYGPDWAPLAAAVAQRGWSPTFICESAGTQAEDALTMKQTYLALLDGDPAGPNYKEEQHMDMERFLRPVDPQVKVPYESQIALWAYRRRKHDESFEEFVMSEKLVEKFNRGLGDPQKTAELRRVLEASEGAVEALLNAFRTAPWTVVKPVVWNNNLNNPYFIQNLTLSHRFEIYIDEQFKAQGLDIGLYYGRDQQYSGENAAGIEIKRDMMVPRTGNVYIEYAEKHYANQREWVDSGILKQDNTRFFLIGDIGRYYLLRKRDLLDLLRKLEHTPPLPVPAGVCKKVARRGTSLGFIIPARVAQGMQPPFEEVAACCERL